MIKRGALVLLILTTAALAGLRAQDILIVNAIPQALSNETDQNSEPSLAVNPLNPKQIVLSVFTPRWGVCDPSLAPLLTSQDGGMTWNFTCVIPSSGSTSDISLKFEGGSTFYAAIIRRPDLAMIVLRWDQIFSNEPMKEILTRPVADPNHIIDQPYLHVSTGSEKLVLVGENDWRSYGPADRKTASLEQANSGPGNAVTFAPLTQLEKRNVQFDDASIRPAIAPDGTAYVSFISVRSWNSQSGMFTADIIVARKDAASSTFDSLVDPNDKLPGIKVSTNRSIPWGCCIGQQRFGSNLSIAVDPNDSQKVFIAWADGSGPNDYNIHVRGSQNAGESWTPDDLYFIKNATNPALAISNQGVLGLLYQRLDTAQAQQRWNTELVFSGKSPIILATTPADAPKVSNWQPYLGDYLGLMTVGADFYGVFSANNTPDPEFFPSKMPVYNRNIKGKSLVARDGKSPIPASIDPFFFRVTDVH